ncbi:MAG: hypothetical protein NVS4B4_12910 [Bradyrhizobium sp.]
MKRIGVVAIVAALAGVFSVLAAGANARSAPVARSTKPAQAAATDISAQRRVRPPATRLRVYPAYQPAPDGVYPRYFPGRNAVRDCSATYVQEFRPSGTVIVPHMSCFWRPG